jgi:hypothetical protein
VIASQGGVGEPSDMLLPDKVGCRLAEDAGFHGYRRIAGDR